MARRNKHSKEQLKTLILSAAANIVEEQGLSALKVRVIAADIGYTVASIYMVFANMDDLNMHLKLNTYQQLLAVLTDLSIEEGSLENRTLHYVAFAFAHKNLWQLLFDSQLEMNEPLLALYRQYQQEMIAIFHEKLGSQTKQITELFINGLYGITTQCLMQHKDLIKAQADVKIFIQCFTKGRCSLP